MKRDSFANNYIAELIYNIVLVILPVIMIPYISRVLGADGIGAYGYAQAISTYFVLFASSGTSTYAQREIAMAGEDIQRKNQIIVDVIKIRILLSIVSAFFLGVICIIYQPYRKILLIQEIYIIAVMFDVTWVYYGSEKFTSVVCVLTVSRLVSFLLTFICVKGSADIWKYALVFALCELISQIVLFVPVSRAFLFNIRRKCVIKKYIQPILLLFIPQIANQIYGAMDKMMIVIISGSEAENGYYEQATKIVALIRIFIVDTLGFVMMPRAARQFAQEDEESLKVEIDYVLNYLCTIMWPLVFGIMGISGQLIPWFLGEKFLKTEVLVNILAFNIVPVGIYTIIGNQVLIPVGKEREYTKSILIGIIINGVLNVYLICRRASVGACYASLVSNVVIAFYQIYHAGGYVHIWKNIWYTKKSMVASLFEYFILIFMSARLESSIVNTGIMLFLAMSVYIVIMFILKDKVVYDMWRLVKKVSKDRW